ncbi:MAG: hypothetical protein ABIP18_00185 [Steroidobacteraceae bacterium]
METIAAGRSVKSRLRLVKLYGFGGWMKRKGFAQVRTSNGTIAHAELHWYEAHGIGKREIKIKRYLQAESP